MYYSSIAHVNFHKGIDDRFSTSVKRVGSSHQVLQLKEADEFEFSIQLLGTGDLSWGTEGSYWTTQACGPYIGMNKEVDNIMNPDLKVILSDTPVLPTHSNGKMLLPLPLPGALKYGNLVFQGNLIPFYVKRQLRSLLQQACSDPQLKGKS